MRQEFCNRAALAGAASLAAFPLQAATPATLFLSHPSALAHDPGPGWPDSPERLRAVFAALAQCESKPTLVLWGKIAEQLKKVPETEGFPQIHATT